MLRQGLQAIDMQTRRSLQSCHLSVLQPKSQRQMCSKLRVSAMLRAGVFSRGARRASLARVGEGHPAVHERPRPGARGARGRQTAQGALATPG